MLHRNIHIFPGLTHQAPGRLPESKHALSLNLDGAAESFHRVEVRKIGPFEDFGPPERTRLCHKDRGINVKGIFLENFNKFCFCSPNIYL